MALTKERLTPRQGNEAVIQLLSLKVAASTKIFGGGAVQIDAGYAKPAATALGRLSVGVARATVDNSAGSDGDLYVDVERGTFKFANGDSIAQADVGKLCYFTDDQTVALASSGTKSVAGTIVGVESDGVWVEIGFEGKIPQHRITLSAAAEAANAIVVTGQVKTYDGNNVAAAKQVVVRTLAVTADKGDISVTTGTAKKTVNPATGENVSWITTDATGAFVVSIANDAAEDTLISATTEDGFTANLKLTFA